MLTKIINSDEELLDWYHDNYESLKKSMPKVIERIESMDRSLLVAECARVHRNNILINQMNSSLRLSLNSTYPRRSD